MLCHCRFAFGLVVFLVVGCRPDPAMHLGVAGAAVVTRDSTAALLSPEKKVLSDRILAAIALERVTGRKPDPRRFIETR